ncbi:MAG TPA: hypothetical protein VHE60_17195 [Pyrinomonadaceae bacterium]|nr:hypothetical protein [Pyrinomonadaceae bacterium]
MKIYIALILAAALCSACGNKQPSESSNSQSTAATQSTPAKAESSKATSESTSGAPVEFIYGGITPDKTSISYKIKVNTDKPIEEVHLALKETDAGGKVVEQTTVAWQNIVHSTQQPIEKGKTYEAQTPLDPGATKAECSLKEVVFQDGTRWTAR